MPNNEYPQPLSGMVVPRFGEVATFMRLPIERDPARLDIALVGVPFDGGTTNRPGARHGPREIRTMSCFMRRVHHVSKVAPYELCRVGDHGDCSVNPIDLHDSLTRIEEFFARLHRAGAAPLTAGGDHLITLPILRAIARERPVGLIHFDAHSDTSDSYFGGEKYTHGTPFRRAIEEGLIRPGKFLQVGLRGQLYAEDDFDFAHKHKVKMITAEEFHAKGMPIFLRQLRAFRNQPVYITLDIDCVDPAYAPGTGTPQVGGFTSIQILNLVRALKGLNIVGCDLVEVSPPFDNGEITSLLAANLLYELLCIL